MGFGLGCQVCGPEDATSSKPSKPSDGFCRSTLQIGSLASSRVLYRDGLPIAALISGEVQSLVSMTPGEQWHARTRLLRTGSLESEAQSHFGPAHSA